MTAPARRVYLDHSATTPTDPRVVEAMQPYFYEVYGNSSSAHRFGQAAEQAADDARETIAHILNCKPAEIVFTSGGTESDNLAIRGTAWTKKYAGEGVHLVSSPVEHSAVLKTVGQLTVLMGFNHTLVPVDHVAMIAADDFAGACWADTTLASIMYVNNEVGTIMPISELAALAHDRGILFHTDAVQAAGQLTLDVQALGVDMMSLSAHKFYGPKGVGLLYVREGIDLVPSQSGGSHEGGRRAGTLNTPAIVGMAKALQLAHEEMDERTAHYQSLRDSLIGGILDRVPEAQLSGHPEQRLPSLASFTFEGIDGNLLVLHLDMKGIAASSASACKTGNPEPSGVLLAMGYSSDLAGSGLRLSVGKDTTEEDVEYAVAAVAETVEKLLRLGQMYS